MKRLTLVYSEDEVLIPGGSYSVSAKIEDETWIACTVLRLAKGLCRVLRRKRNGALT